MATSLTHQVPVVIFSVVVLAVVSLAVVLLIKGKSQAIKVMLVKAKRNVISNFLIKDFIVAQPLIDFFGALLVYHRFVERPIFSIDSPYLVNLQSKRNNVISKLRLH